MDWHYLYLLLMGASVILPLLWSFEPKVAYYKSFKALFPAIFVVGLVFIIWDIIFTSNGYWGFNGRYLSGWSLWGLPLGEYLFFVVIPFCCVFVYRVLNYYYPNEPWGEKLTRNINNYMMGFSAALAITFYDRWYTVTTFTLLLVLIGLHSRVWKTAWMAKFYRAYLIILVPFFIVNGILTGLGIDEQVVWYNEDEMIGRRIGTIPLEDAFYGMLLILGVVTIYEYLGKRLKMSFAQDTVTE